MKNALITGASSGIGEEIARILSAQGYSVYLIGRNEKKLEQLSIELKGKFLAIDLNERGSAKLIYDWIVSMQINIHFLVNNAGIGTYSLLEKSSLSETMQMIQVNVSSLVELTHYFVPQMKKLNQKAHILNISSIAAYLPMSNFAVYSGTKAFVKNFSESLALELSDSFVTVTHVAPGGTKTAFMSRSKQDLSKRAEMFMMTPTEVADYAIKACERGAYVGVPGVSNFITTLIPRLLPAKLLVSLVSFIFGKFAKSSAS